MPKPKLIALLFASLLVPAIGLADPFDPKSVPADAKWLLHADVDAARNAKSFAMIRDRILASNGVQAKLDQIEQITSMRIPEDLHDVTIYGNAPGDDAAIVIVHGQIDRQKTTSALSMAQQFGSKDFGSYKVLTWLDTDKNQTMYGAFHDDSTVLIGHAEKGIEQTLDAMDGKTESLTAASPLMAGSKPAVLMYVAAKDMPQLHGANEKPNPVVAAVESAWISVSEKDDEVTLKSELTTKSADAARNLQNTLTGLKGMLGLAAGGDQPDPLAKAVVSAAGTFSATQKDKTVAVDWPVPVDQLSEIVRAIADKAGK